MCACTPNVRTPCCGKDACHRARIDQTRPCPFCASNGHPAKRPTVQEAAQTVVDAFEGVTVGAKQRAALDQLASSLAVYAIARAAAEKIVDKLWPKR